MIRQSWYMSVLVRESLVTKKVLAKSLYNHMTFKVIGARKCSQAFLLKTYVLCDIVDLGGFNLRFNSLWL